MVLSRHILVTVAVSTLIIGKCDGFALGLHVPGKTLRRSSSFHDRRPWTPGRRRNVLFSRDHEVLSVPVSGPRNDSKNSWEDIMNPRDVSETTHDSITLFDKAVIGATAIVAAFSLYAIFFLTVPGAWRYFCAGGICAATSHAIPTPIDVIKVRQMLKEIRRSLSHLTHIS
jgi:hypothetical protein